VTSISGNLMLMFENNKKNAVINVEP